MPNTSSLVVKRYSSARQLGQSHVEQLLRAIRYATGTLTSVELATYSGLTHQRVMNLLGHLKRRDLIQATLIKDFSWIPSPHYIVNTDMYRDD